MPKRQITLEQAAEAFRKAGLRVKVEGIDQAPKPLDIIQKPPKPNPYGRSSKPVLNSLVKITLYARHTIGKGGKLVLKDGEKSVENNTYQTYGPGVCHVSSEIASELLHQDALARQADERFLDRTQRQFVIGAFQTAMGGVVYRGIEVDTNSFYDAMSNQFTNSPYRGI
jgi:hypothetical protein